MASLPHTISSAGSPCARLQVGSPRCPLPPLLPGASWFLPLFGSSGWGIAQPRLAQSKTFKHHTCAVDRTSELDDTSSLPRPYCQAVRMRRCYHRGSLLRHGTSVLMHRSSYQLPAPPLGFGFKTASTQPYGGSRPGLRRRTRVRESDALLPRRGGMAPRAGLLRLRATILTSTT